MRDLSPRQQAVLEFLSEYQIQNGYMPSIRETGKHFGINSLRGATVHFDALERKGYIERHPGVIRGIKILKQPERKDMRKGIIHAFIITREMIGKPFKGPDGCITFKYLNAKKELRIYHHSNAYMTNNYIVVGTGTNEAENLGYELVATVETPGGLVLHLLRKGL